MSKRVTLTDDDLKIINKMIEAAEDQVRSGSSLMPGRFAGMQTLKKLGKKLSLTKTEGK